MDKKAGFSLNPDPWMRWIYDNNDPRYKSAEARSLRERRAQALRDAPRWMTLQAEVNDALRKETPNVEANRRFAEGGVWARLFLAQSRTAAKRPVERWVSRPPTHAGKQPKGQKREHPDHQP